jgi:hypothetical protein
VTAGALAVSGTTMSLKERWRKRWHGAHGLR